MNLTPLFWRTSHHAMLLAAFVSLARVFDQDSKHNLDHLMTIVSNDLSIFSKDALRLRKEAYVSKADAAAFVKSAHELTPGDIKSLKKLIAVRRTNYKARYRSIRDMVFAHNGVPDTVEADKLFAKTNV